MHQSYASSMLGIPRIILEALVALAVDRTMSTFIPHLLPYAWMAILAVFTLEIIKMKIVQNWLLRTYSRWGAKHLMASYIVVSLIGAGLFGLYWRGVNKIFVILEAQKKTNDTGENFSAKIQSWLTDLGFSVEKSKAVGAIFVLNVTTNNGAIVVINWPENNKNIIFLNTMLAPSQSLKTSFNNLNTGDKHKILSAIKIELLKMDIGFVDYGLNIDKIILDDSVPIKNLTDKEHLRDRIWKIERASRVYSELLFSKLHEFEKSNSTK